MMPILVGMFLLEHRAYYQEDASPELIKAIESRVTVLDEDVLQYIEVPIMTEFTTQILFDELLRKIEEGNFKAIYFDLSQANVPNITVRKILYERFEVLVNEIEMFSFSTGKNAMMNIALKFFMNSVHTNLNNAQFCKDKTKALAFIYEKLGR